MARPDASALLPLAESIADGSPVDWIAVESQARVEDQALIRQLRILSDLANLHRTMPAHPGDLPHALVARRTAAAPAIGRWASLDLIERIGGGTFGDVYRAWDRHLEREVALKLLRSDETGDDSQAARIVTEGRLLARVHHPNVVTVHGVSVHDGRVGLWMELVSGATLEQVLRNSGPFSATEAAVVGIDLCRALAAIHKAGLIHRDVKAQNVLREEGGRIVLMDLGTGREILPAGRQGPPDLAGTPLYLAPEIFSGGEASERTDLFSLGVLLYHLVTGSFPVQATTIEELKAAHAQNAARRLRDARADLPTDLVRVIDRAIATEPGDRYASAGELESDLARTLDSVTMAEPPARSGVPVQERRFGTGSMLALAAAAVVVVGLAATPWIVNRWKKPSPVAAGVIRSIAVLPLVNLSGDPSQEYFADGMTDELIATLGAMGGVNVISRTSTSQFKGSNKQLPEIARALHVDAVLEGTVRVTSRAAGQEGDPRRVRVNARLIYAGTDTPLWERTFEHVLSDVFVLQSDIATAVAGEINVRLTPAQRDQLAGIRPRNAEAQEAYLQGRGYLTNAARGDLEKAREALERAVRLDPEYARAHAALAVNYVWLQLVGAISQSDAKRLAVGAANRALRLEPNLAEAHGALANVRLSFDWDWAGAGAGYNRAVTLNPSYTLARRDYAWYLAALGRLDPALQQARLAQEADPLSAEASGAVGMMLYFNRRFDEAIAELRKTVSLAPGTAQPHNGLARSYAAIGSYQEAVSEINEAIRISEGAPVYVAELARTYAAAGDAPAAREILTRLERRPTRSEPYVSPEARAYVYAALGEPDRAFRLLSESVRAHSPTVLWAKVDPRLDSLRQDPRFSRLLQEMGVNPR